MQYWIIKLKNMILSPTQVELSFVQKEKQIIEFLIEKATIFRILFIALVVGLFLILNSDFFSPEFDFKTNGGYGVLRLIRFSIGWLILLSPISLFLNNRYRKIGFILITLYCWGVSAWFFFGPIKNILLLISIYVSYPSQLLLSYYFLKLCPSENKQKKVVLVYGLIFFLIEILISYFIWSYGAKHKATIFWNLKAQFIFFSTLAAFFFSKKRKKFAVNFLIPVNCLLGFIWPISTTVCANVYEEKVKLWVHGMFNIFVGYSAIFIRDLYEIYVLQSFTNPYFKYSGIYILAILAIIGHLNILCGAARIYGMVVIDATRFIWLARSPGEYWRRGLVYHYIFITNFIHLGLYRRIKLITLCTFLAFAFFLIKKIGIVNYTIFASHFFGLGFFESENATFGREIITLYHWLLWFILLLISPYFFYKTRLFENKVYAWLSIFMTHFVMATCYYISRLLYQYTIN